jgi:hypothetical protein
MPIDKIDMSDFEGSAQDESVNFSIFFAVEGPTLGNFRLGVFFGARWRPG